MTGPLYAYFGVNPSTADASVDDATVRKWIGFTKVFGGRKFIVGNAFAYRATDVRELAKVDDPYGDEIGDHVSQIIDDADILVPCWGDTGKVPPTLRGAFDVLMDALTSSGKPVLHFGLTKSGDPKHPLMLGYNTPLIPWGVREGGVAQQAPVQEPVRPDILEKLSYHLLERDDMTLDDCLTYLQTGGWHKVRGRTERSMVLQLTDLMASAPAQPAPSSTSLTALVQSPAIDAATKLRGEAKVMRTLLEESLKVLATLEPEDDNERAHLTSLKNMIRAVVEHSYTVHS
jgi:hypothetical protein